MLRLTPLTIGETYHVYNRGAHKSAIFMNDSDYDRFLLLSFLCNSSAPVLVRDVLTKYRGRTSVNIFDEEPKPNSPLVSVLAYALMPNHYHFILRQIEDGGISAFMRKVGTAYTMYFNTKYDHSGVLTQGKFQSRHIDNEPYFRYIFSYVHLNPVDLVESDWENKGIRNKKQVRDFLNDYRYSSFVDYAVGQRAESVILDMADIPGFLTTQNDLEDMLAHYTEAVA